MKNKILTSIILIIISKFAFAQFTTVNYAYDANGNRWNRTIQFTLNKTGPFDTTANSPINKPFKESILDSFGIKEIAVFPNPTYEKIRINILSNSTTPLVGTIKLFNALGTTQLLSQSISLNNEIDLTSLSNGNYLIKVEVNGKIKTYKILKVN